MKFGSLTSLTINKLMSRIGKKPIEIPQGVEVKIDGQRVVIKGPRGELSRHVRPEISVVFDGQKIILSPKKTSKQTNALWGLFRVLLYNMVEGVTKGFEKKLEIEGVGYRANIEGEDLVLQVGFSHPVKIKALEGIKFVVEKNIISVSGNDKELVGELAAKIKNVRKAEPYKGRGIKYLGEKIRRKLGKRAAATTA